MHNWIRDKFGANRVRTNPTQEQRLAPVRPDVPGAGPSNHGTYASIIRSVHPAWINCYNLTTTHTTYTQYYLWDTEAIFAKPVYPSKIALPEGL